MVRRTGLTYLHRPKQDLFRDSTAQDCCIADEKRRAAGDERLCTDNQFVEGELLSALFRFLPTESFAWTRRCYIEAANALR